MATIAGGVTSVVVSAALGADPAAIATWYWGAVDGLVSRIQIGYAQTRGRAMQFLPRHAALSGAAVRPVGGSLDAARLRERLRIVGPVGFKSAISAGQTPAEALRHMATNMGGVADEAVRGGDRDVVTQTATQGRGVVGWRRRLSGRACGFCSMLASRGAVYVDRKSATVARDGAAYHPHCHCWAEPLYAHDREPAEVRKLQRQWARITAGHRGADAQRVWRQHWNRVHPPTRSLSSQAGVRLAGAPDLSTLNVEQLRALARERGITGFSKLRKQELIDALGPGTPVKAAKVAPRKLRPESSPRLTPEELSVYAARRHAATQLPLVDELAANGASAKAVTARMRTHMRRLNSDIVPVDASGAVLTNTADAAAARYVWRRPGASEPLPDAAAVAAGKKAIQEYANSDAIAARINGTLRRGEPVTPDIAKIDAAMRVSRLDEDAVFWRGVNELEQLSRQGGVRRALGLDPGQPLPADLVGHEFTELGFASTSTRRSLAEVFGTSRESDFLLEVRAPRGTHAVRVGSGEGEVLLDRGLTYRVVGDRTETRMVGLRGDQPRHTRVLTVEVLPPSRSVDVIDLSAPIPRALAGDEIFAAEFATAQQMARTAVAVERAARAGDDIVAAARAATPVKAAKKTAVKKAAPAKTGQAALGAAVHMDDVEDLLRRAGLSDAQQLAAVHQLRQYKYSNFVSANRMLHDPASVVGDVDILQAQGIIKGIDPVFAHARLSDDIIVYRGEKAGMAYRFQEGQSVKLPPGVSRLDVDNPNVDLTGAEWTARSYQSTSAKRSIAEDFVQSPDPSAPLGLPTVMTIRAPKGSPAISLARKADGLGSGEAEILFGRGLRFRVVADHGLGPDGVRRLDVEILPTKAATKATPAKKAAPAKKAPPQPTPTRMSVAALKTELERAGVTGIPVRAPKAQLVEEVTALRAGAKPGDISARFEPPRVEGKVGPKAAKLPKVADPGDARAQAVATNPKYGTPYGRKITPEVERAGGASYAQNCTRVVMAYEMRRRGIRVTAGIGTPAGDITAVYVRSFRLDGKYGVRVARDLSRNMSARQIATEVETWPLGARGIVTMRGHTLNVERHPITGKAVFIDAQAATKQNPTMTLAQFQRRASARGAPTDRFMAVARVDDLDLSDYSLRYVEAPELDMADGQILKTDFPSDPASDRLPSFEDVEQMPTDDRYP